MFTLLLVIAGLILLLVSPPLFAAAATVGWICIGVASALVLTQLLVFGLALKAQANMARRFRRF